MRQDDDHERPDGELYGVLLRLYQQGLAGIGTLVKNEGEGEGFGHRGCTFQYFEWLIKVSV